MRSKSGVALDFASTFDAALDQVANGEAHIGLEGFDVGGVQPIAQAWHVGRGFDFEPAYRRAVEGVPSGVLRFTRAHMELPSAPAPETKMNVMVGRASTLAAAVAYS